jgi:hypothetical protein
MPTMVERDRLDRRAFAATALSDANDPPQFGQILETVRDAVVEEVRFFFNQPRLNTVDPERRREIPTVRKYAVGFGPGTDPYETVQQILSDFADTAEKLPHVAVTAVSGASNRMTAGQPLVAHVQLQPRVETANAEPYALAVSAFEEWTATVTTAVVGTMLRITIGGQDFTYTVIAGDTTQTAAAGLRDALRAAEPIMRIDRTGSTITIRSATANVPITISAAAGVTLVLVQAAGIAGADRLVFRTTPDHFDAVEETVEFRADRFQAAFPASAARAQDIARIFNEQARYAYAVVIPVGAGSGVRFLARGDTPNEIEILSSSTSNLVTALGLGSFATGAGPDAITGAPPDTPMTLTATGVGTAASAAAAIANTVDPYITLSGASLGVANAGRFRVLSVVGANAVTYDNPDGVAESFTGDQWFIGRRDTWENTARPVMNRRHIRMQLTVTISVLAESPNERDELHDLVLTQFAYYLEEKYFTLLGRGFFDEAFDDELWQASIGQDVTAAGQSQTPRGQDQKGVYEARVSLPVTLFWYQDRSTIVPYGPQAGESWVVRGDDIIPLP